MGFKISRREVEVAVPQDKMFKLKDVIEVILKQVQGEVEAEVGAVAKADQKFPLFEGFG